MTVSTIGAGAIAQLRRAFDDRLITPDDAGYDAARTVKMGGADRRPSAIVRPASAEEVATVVAYARDHGLDLAVRSGGHSLAGHGVGDGIVLDLAGLRHMEIDAERRTAWAQTGLTAAEYTTAAARYGLATGFGDTGSVGIGGLTLGGGIGYLVRKHGLTIDDVLAAEIVTADGQVRHVDSDTHPDLFWAIRGGGGNFGVVTRMKFRLHRLDTVVGGMLVLPATPRTIRDFVAAAQAAPDELSTIANVMAAAPPLPFLAREHWGQPVLLATVCYAGDPGSASHVLAPLRAIATPIADMIRPIPYPEIYPPDHEGEPLLAVNRNLFVDSLDHTRAEAIVDRLRSATATMAVVQLRVLGGAMARVPSAATAFAHRDRGIMANVTAAYRHAGDATVHGAWADDLTDALRDGYAGAYVNFIGDDGADRVRDAYPGRTWDRLREIKAAYDPGNIFRRNHNIPPSPQRER